MDKVKMTNQICAMRYTKQGFQEKHVHVNREIEVTLRVNGNDFITLLCSPNMIEDFVIGYLYNEKMIQEITDIQALDVTEDHIAHITLREELPPLPEAKTRTSGMGNGITFQRKVTDDPLSSSMTLSAEQLFYLMKEKQKSEVTYQLCGGIHSTAICSKEGVLAFAEDIGRHNTFDKVCGYGLRHHIDMEDKILLTSGRISSEMVQKALRVKIPIVVSLSTATEKAVALADRVHMTLVGYCRNDSFTIYTGSEKFSRMC